MSEILNKLKQYNILDLEVVDGEIELLDPKDDRHFIRLNKAQVLQLSQELQHYVEKADNKE